MDLFEHYEMQPEELKKIVEYWANVDENYGLSYDELEEFKRQCEEIGFTFDYDLSGQPFNLRALEIPCKNAKYNPFLDSIICECCEADGGNDTQAKDLKLWQEVILKRDNTIWYIGRILSDSLHLVPTKSIRHKNAGIIAFDFQVQPYNL